MRMPDYWRDADSERRQFGLVLRGNGGDLRFGRRLYRWRWLPPENINSHEGTP